MPQSKAHLDQSSPTPTPLFRTQWIWPGVAIGASALLAIGQLTALSAADAAAPPTPAAATFIDLGTAASYSIIGGTGVANTGVGTVLSGNLGLSPSGAISGFPPGVVTGAIHDKDAAAETAAADAADAYADAAAQTSTDTFAGDQAGKTFHPGSTPPRLRSPIRARSPWTPTAIQTLCSSSRSARRSAQRPAARSS